MVLFVIPLLLLAVTFHEFAHGWMAFRLGDTTAKDSGRLTLNPLAHIDIVGMVLVPLLLFFTLGFPVGWAKPVPVNHMMLNNPKRDMIWVALMGPLANLTLAFVTVISLKLGFFSGLPLLQTALVYFVVINLALAFLNLIPIPPLDGSRILSGLLPRRQAMALSKLEPYGFFILIALLYFGFVSRWIHYGMKIFFNLMGLNGLSGLTSLL